jgi:hypothetical protein
MRLFLFALCAVLVAADAQAQHEHHTQEPAATAPEAWSWDLDANAFVTFNYQQRKFTDFSAVESANWLMVRGVRQHGRHQLTLNGMLSLEPFTVQGLGSPQVFQTGESYHGVPLIDRQHPHDLFMQIGAAYRLQRTRVAVMAGVDLVGPATLGPTPFMHRESARENPQVPLTHHQIDSTHVTPGVVRGGLDFRTVQLEGSWFRGEEPDDNRLNIERPRLDSWAARATWRRGPWEAQFSGGHLHQPEWFDPFDVTRLTATIGYTGPLWGRRLAATVGWGENREFQGVHDGYLLEWTLESTRRSLVYGRVENTAKNILTLGVHQPGAPIHAHVISEIAAATLGYEHDFIRNRSGRWGAGADATLYHVSDNLVEPYGSPHSFHVFLRYRPSTSPDASQHVH